MTFDPNIRPGLVGDVATVRAVTEEIASVCDLVKLSEEDAAWLYPGAPVPEVLLRFLELGARLVAVTRGSDGALLATNSARAAVAPRPVRERDTVGAGDTFMASLVASLAEGQLGSDEGSLRAAGETAALAASITVSRAGADLPTRAEVEAQLGPVGGSRHRLR